MILPQKYLLLMTGTLLLLLQACAVTVPLQGQDVSGRVWLQISGNGEVVDGFFADPGGHLLLVDDVSKDGVSWELLDGHLLLWFRADQSAALQSTEYRPFRHDEGLVLSPDLESGSVVYVAAKLQEPLSNVKYMPTFIRGSSVPLLVKDNPVYLLIDTDDKSLRGYGGVNNFLGNYQRIGLAGFKMGPMDATMMAGPGIDDEVKFMKCLTQANAILSVQDRLFLYQEARLLCSFQAN